MTVSYRQVAAFCLFITVLIPTAIIWAAESIQPAADAPQPLTPAESLQRFQLPPGFRVELVACEPDIADPTGIAFDARGRLFVCELHGYNLEGHYDVQELNKTGVLDTQVRRILAPPEALAKAEKETYGTVKLLEDTDGDGRMDRMSVWADRLPPCYGLVPAGDGVLVVCAPDILFLADRDGDGRAEVQERLLTGFGVGEMWTRINNPCWEIDNWIYVASGQGSGGTIRGPHLKTPVVLGNTCFRFKADGSRIEPVSGGTSGFGLAHTDWGDRFLVTNQQHALLVAPLPFHYLARNPYYAAPNPIQNICTYGHPARVFPTSQPDPWRAERARDPAWVKFYGPNETSAGLVTSACAPLVYRADQFPREYRDNHFSCEPAQNLIHRCLLEPLGAGYIAKRATEDREFLTSTEQWFRPVNLALGPDGALYVVDMYREIIEDYSAIPRYLQQQYGLIIGHDRGRIWRIVAQGGDQAPPLDLAALPTVCLVKQLASGNAWQRLTAQRLIVERQEQSAVPHLAALLIGGPTPQARLHALYTLSGLDAISPDAISACLDDAHYALRLHGLRLADEHLQTPGPLVDRVLSMVDDPHPQVRLQLAFTLGQFSDERRLYALGDLARGEGQDPWLQAAILSSLPDASPRMLGAILSSETRGQGVGLVRPLAAITGRRQRPDELGQVLMHLAAAEASPTLVVSGLEGLLESLERAKLRSLDDSVGRLALKKLLTASSPDVRSLALRLAGMLQLGDAPEIVEAFAAAAEMALDERAPAESRLAAMQLLSAATPSIALPTAEALLDARQPLVLQLAAVTMLASLDSEEVAPLLLQNWKSYSPEVRAATLEAIFGRQDRLPALLDTLEGGLVPPQSVDPLRRQQLQGDSRAAIAARASKLFDGAVTGVAQEVIDRFQAALSGPRDPVRGHEMYVKHCSTCHKLQGQGSQVGPDLATTKTRTDETLLLDLLDPSAQITAGYPSYVVVTDSGRIYTGILAEESATSITLKWQEGVSQTLLREEIDTIVSSDLSLMPADFHSQVTPQDVADLFGYLREALGPVPPPGRILFDDEPDFVHQLREGDGTARLITTDRFSGAAALAITPPQKFSPQIADWKFPIRERPGPDEYRYLRFAWKTRGAGVMLELAADGKWPPANQPTRRYFSGANTTGWQARQLSPAPPTEWTEVIVDLWQDFGDFTLTGLAPTAMGDEARFDRIELLKKVSGTFMGV